MYEGKDFEYGSVREYIAMAAYARQRSADCLAASLAVVAPENASKAVKQLRGLVFPEEGYDDLIYLKKAKDSFEKLRKYKLKIQN